MLSTRSEIEEFLESMLWKDFIEELKTLSKIAYDEYDGLGEPLPNGQYPTQAEILISLGNIKGRREAVNYFLSIPDILLQQLEEQEDDNRRQPAD